MTTKKFVFLMTVVVLASSFRQQSGKSDMDRFIDKLMSEMSIREKIGQLNLITPGGGIPTGSAVSTDVEEKIKNGQVGGIFGISGPPERIRHTQEMAVNDSRLGIPLLFGLFDDPYRYIDESLPEKEILTAENRHAARDAAARSFVLLKNEGNILPLNKNQGIVLFLIPIRSYQNKAICRRMKILYSRFGGSFFIAIICRSRINFFIIEYYIGREGYVYNLKKFIINAS